MSKSEGLPPYPPPRAAWTFAPPPAQRRWTWLAIVAMLLLVAAGALAVAALVDLEGRDDPDVIDDRALLTIIERECALLGTTVESMPVTGTPREQGDAIVDQNLAIDRMVTSIEGAGGDLVAEDRPARRWLDDWRTLADARNRYVVAALKDSSARFKVPRDSDGAPLPERMNDTFANQSGCAVPPALLSPYPEPTAV